MVIRWARALTEVVVPDPGLGRAAGGARLIRAVTGVRVLRARGRRGRTGRRTGGGARGIGRNQRQQDGEERDERSREPVTCGRDGVGRWAHAPSPSCRVFDFPLADRGGRQGSMRPARMA
ncbi:hypothetical protein GCM10009579_02320 [Streptomyces javensis]|uniref:Uncharacterized protein n=1 Tax=Streptomyces javensis TaxID=114698 RepID=A0ABN1WF05_9ACTN